MSNFYPDLNDDNQDKANLAGEDHLPKGNYRSTPDQKTEEKKHCCVLYAQIWICIVGILTAILGLFVVVISLYAKFGYTDYPKLSAALPTGGIWMIFSFGLVLTCFSVILILATCLYKHCCFKVVLVVFAIILAILLILEIASASVMVWGLGVIAIPKSNVGDAAADQLLEARNATAYGTWKKCCVDNHPPYDSHNITNTIDSVCLWPDDAPAVEKDCGDKNVLVCVCKDATTYAAYFGVFLQGRLMWVGIVIIILAFLLLCGLIATCVLVWTTDKKTTKKKEKANAMHTDE